MTLSLMVTGYDIVQKIGNKKGKQSEGKEERKRRERRDGGSYSRFLNSWVTVTEQRIVHVTERLVYSLCKEPGQGQQQQFSNNPLQ